MVTLDTRQLCYFAQYVVFVSRLRAWRIFSNCQGFVVKYLGLLMLTLPGVDFCQTRKHITNLLMFRI